MCSVIYTAAKFSAALFCSQSSRKSKSFISAASIHLRKMVHYLTEQRGRPNSTDYRIYLSKFTLLIHKNEIIHKNEDHKPLTTLK